MPLNQSATGGIIQRIAELDWASLSESFWSGGYHLTESLLSESECLALAAMFEDDSLFRKTTNMAHHNYGSGFYKYFKYPLPEVIAQMRVAFYEHLVPTANAFNEALGSTGGFPAAHETFIELCHEQGQTRPTPLLLHYDAGDFNRMHQDIYGELAFPFQITCFLSEPHVDFEGGEFLIEEQSARAQSRVHVIRPKRGQIILFTTRHRPEKGVRTVRRMNVKHGVATVESGSRFTLGIIFHDAK